MAQPRIIQRIKAAIGVSLPTAGTSWASIPRADTNYTQAVGNGRESSVVTAPLAWIIRNWTESSLVIRSIDDEDGMTTPLPTHQLALKLRQPNAEYSGTTLQKATIADYKIDGNAYWLCALDRSGRIAEIWWAPTSTMTPEAVKYQDEAANAQTRQTDYYLYQPGNGQTYRIAPLGHIVPGTEPGLAVLHFRDGIDPNNPLLGASALKSVLREVYTDDEASIYTASLLRNMGVPGIIVSPVESAGALPPPAPEDVKETKRAFHQATTGAHRGEPIIMTGPTKLETFGYDPSQMNLATLRRIPEERVCGALGVQPSACGLGAVLEQAKFANMQQAREASWEEGILPTQRDIAETIAMKLLPLYESQPESFEVAFDVTMVRALSEDMDRIADRAGRLMNSGVITLGEAREMLGMDVDDSHDIWRMQLNLIDIPEDSMATGSPAAEAQPADQAAPAQPAADQGMPPEDAPEDSPDFPQARQANTAAAGTKANQMTSQQRRAILLLQRQAEVLMRPFARELEAAFNDLGKLAVREWRAAGGSDVTGVPAKEDPQGFGSRIAAMINATLKAMKLGEWSQSVLGTIYQKHQIEVISETYNGLAGMGITVGQPDAVQVDVLRANGTRYRLVDIAKQTEDAIRAAIADGLAESKGPVEIERLIRSYVEGGPSRNVSYRAMRIARTEVLHSQRSSSLAFYQESGLYGTVLVYDNLLGFDDEDCMARDGQEVPFDEAASMMDDEHPNGTLGFGPGTLLA